MAQRPRPKPIAVLALTTIGGVDEGRALARLLVETRVAACVSLVPRLASLYRWRGQIEEQTETLLLIKTTGDRLAELKGCLEENHPYELPELLCFEADRVSERYAGWLEASVERGDDGR